MPAGDAFSTAQRADIERAISLAEKQCPMIRFSVYVGALEHGRQSASVLHAAFGADAPHVVLVAVDPGHRQLEIVTGAMAAEWLDDRACGLAALSMTTAFAAGDLMGGLRGGVQVLAEHARHPRTLHTDLP